jgi:prevent-host-death family protein
MTITTISSREFNQDASGAKRAASEGPVIITDRGEPAHVLLTYEAYQILQGNQLSLYEALRQKDEDDFDFTPPRMGDDVSRPADLS